MATRKPDKALAADYLKKFLASRQLEQGALAGRLGVDDAAMSSWLQGRNNIDRTKLGTIIQLLNPPENDAVQFVHACRPELKDNWVRPKLQAGEYEFINFPALDEKWLDAQKEKYRAGLLLEALREQKPMNQEDLAKQLGIEQNTISNWESGINKIEPSKLGSIVSVLEPELRYATRLIFLRCPELKNMKAGLPEDWAEAWVHTKIGAGRYDYINYPSLDPMWRNAQPEAERAELAGTMLTALRECADWTQKQLGEELGRQGQELSRQDLAVQEFAISKWEKGKAKILPKYHQALFAALGLSDVESSDGNPNLRTQFKNQILESNAAIDARNKAKSAIKNPEAQLGSALPPTHPALEKLAKDGPDQAPDSPPPSPLPPK